MAPETGINICAFLAFLQGKALNCFLASAMASDLSDNAIGRTWPVAGGMSAARTRRKTRPIRSDFAAWGAFYERSDVGIMYLLCARCSAPSPGGWKVK
jgi:hypothetical protein